MNIKYDVDVTGAQKKTETIKRLPVFLQYLLTEWATKTVETIKKARILRGKPINVGMEIRGGDKPSAIIGTGVGTAKEVPYGRIQDEGGTIHAKDKLLTIPIPPAKGRVANYPGRFYIKSKAGNVLCCQRTGKGLKILFVLKEQVTIPASHWFSKPLGDRLWFLDNILDPDTVWKMAQEFERKTYGS
jgi:hypothetical protein